MSAIRKITLSQFLSIQKSSQCLGRSFRVGIINNPLRNQATASDDIQASEKMQNILQKRFPKAKKIIVNDLSGGCGSMYEIFVETVEFKGLPLVKQHMLINETLKEQIKDMHGLTVKTKIPDGS